MCFTLVALWFAAAAGCLSDPSANVGFDEPDPQARLRAVRVAAEADDQAAIKSLIEMLDSDDPAERFFAIGTLTDLAGGETFGYRHWEDRSERRDAITRWVEWESRRATPPTETGARAEGLPVAAPAPVEDGTRASDAPPTGTASEQPPEAVH